MKTSLMMAAQFVVVTFVGAAAFAHGAGGEHVMGTVKAMSDSALTVTTKDGKDVAIGIDAKTKFEKDGKAATAKDLKAGDRVAVHARKDGDKLVAEVVKVGKEGKDDDHDHDHHEGHEGH